VWCRQAGGYFPEYDRLMFPVFPPTVRLVGVGSEAEERVVNAVRAVLGRFMTPLAGEGRWGRGDA
jgi:hypothetical protein